MGETVVRKSILLAFGEGALNQAVLKSLQDSGFQVTIINWDRKVRLPRRRYDYLVQMGADPIALIEGTRQLLEKAREDKAEFLLISSLNIESKPLMARKTTHRESLHFAETLTAEFYKKHGLRTVILRLPTIFGPGIPLKDSGTLGHLIAESSSDSTTLTVYGEGKDRHYFLYLTDAAKAVKEALAIREKKGEIYFAVPPSPISSATIAELLKKLGGEKHEVHYHKGLTATEEEIKPKGKALPRFKPQTPLKDGIIQMVKVVPEAKKQRPFWNKKWSWSLSKRRVIQLGVLLLLLSPFIYGGGRVSLVTFHLSRFYQQVRFFNFQTASHSAEAIRDNLIALDRFLGMVPILSRKAPLHDLRLLSQGGIEFATASLALLGEGETALATAENLFKSYQGESVQKDTEEKFYQLAASFNEAEDRLLAAWGHLNQTHPTIHRLLTPLIHLSQQGAAVADLGAVFTTSASDLLGYQGERNYLILFQNSAEIRAGGGFLGSLAKLTLKDGGIKSLDFFDSYQFDHINPALITPIPAIKEFTDSKKSPLRESNFYASFPESAQRIGQIFELSHDIEINGVIGINLLLAEKLVGAVGALDLVGFDRTITAENLFEVTTEEVEKGFFPGSSKKRRFLQALGEGLLSKLFALKRADYANVAKVIWEGLKRKDLILFFKEGGLAQTLIETGFDGRVKKVEGDFLMILDSSYGSKTNVWIERTVNYRVFNMNRNDQLKGVLTITWSHHGTEAWPSGAYDNVFRALVPKGSRLTKASLNDKNILSKTLVAEEAGKTELAFRFSVKPQTTAVLKLDYRLPSSLNLKQPNSQYSLYIQKQPGTRGDAFTFSFEEPFGKQIFGEGFQRTDSNLFFEGLLEEDIGIELKIKEENE